LMILWTNWPEPNGSQLSIWIVVTGK
jgi:hypothetical protein